jgi:hypothetical protein
MPKASVVHVAGYLLLQALRVRCRDGPVLLAQLGRAGERIRCYWRNSASVPRSTRVSIVLVSWHLRATLLLVVGL